MTVMVGNGQKKNVRWNKFGNFCIYLPLTESIALAKKLHKQQQNNPVNANIKTMAPHSIT